MNAPSSARGPLLLAVAALLAGLAVTLPTRPAAAAAAVCSVYCDTRDPSQAQQETFPVPEQDVNGRRIVLHLSDADGMAWGSIDNGSVGDSVWLDRTWDDGSTWDGLLGKASIPQTWTGTRTLMYNLADPANHRRGMVRACGDGNGVRCTDWIHLQVCDAVCDGADETTAVGDNQPVPETTLRNRHIALHIDDRGLAWATLTGGTAGDEVWLDRSWDEGASWPGGSSLGRVSVPTASTSTRTILINTQDPTSLLYGGAVRACGRAVEGQEGSCTAWARPATDRPAAAADALMYAYDPDTAWWPSSWWNSAAALTQLMDWMKRTGRTDYRWVVDRTFEVNKVAFPAGVKSSDAVDGDFISRAIDDTGWWGLAWVQAYDLTGDAKYLNEAATIANYINQFWDPSTCGGGVWSDRERTYKNAVTVGLYIRLTAALHNRIAGDTTWLARARTGWSWFTASGLVNSAGLVNDGLTGSCTNNNGTVWTYNQGLAIGGAVELWQATGDAGYLTQARQLADAAISSPVLTRNGILTESCDQAGTCDDNQKQFKGIFMRYLMNLADATRDSGYRAYAQRQADAIWQDDRDNLNHIAQNWSGGATANPQDWRTEASALAALLAATPAPATTASLPCDVYGAAGTPCVAAHSTVRALFSGYGGPLYQLTRVSDGARHDVGLLSVGGYANARDQDDFCNGTTCTITKIYDQTPRHNDLVPGPAGTAGMGPDRGADAAEIAVMAGGHKVYGVWISPGVGYRYTGVASGVAVNGQPEGVYMVASGTHVGSACCFDYGNAERTPADTGNGHMDAVSIATTCYFPPCSGSGPWVEADMENGMFQGGNGTNTANFGNGSTYVTALLKNNGQTTYALKGGNAQSGGLTTWWNGALPNRGGYTPMQQEGGIILGTGGDNSNSNMGTFFEGVMTAGYPSDAADDAVQANIVSVGYSGRTNVPNGPQGTITGPGGKCVDVAGDDTGGNYTAVQLWDCQNYAEDQRWEHYTDNSLRALGCCLDIDGNGTANGTPVELWDCNGVGGQTWVQRPDGSLFNPQSGRCLDSPGGNTANGTRLQIWDCNGSGAQKFAINAGGAILGPAGKCVDVGGDDTGGNGTPVQLWDCQSFAIDQHWYHNANGSLTTLGRCLDINGNGTANGTPVQLWDCDNAGGQVWTQHADGSLFNPQSGRCLDSPGGGTTNGTRLQIWDCNGSGAQKFALS